MTAIFFSLVLSMAMADDSLCQSRGDSIYIQTSTRKLHLCEASTLKATYSVSLGKGGVDKHVEGDGKTPLGKYPLGEPRSSTKFKTFIPVDYPTAAQRGKGFTGGAIGIHGPARGFRWLGGFNSWFDWTQGCIALSTDDEIEEISKWVKAKKVVSVSID